MKIFVDENIPKTTVREIREQFKDVKDIRGSRDEGISDERIWEQVVKEKRLLITTDKGFSRYRYQKHNGIIIVLLKQPTLMKIHQRILSALNMYPEKEWENRLVIMRDHVKTIWPAED